VSWRQGTTPDISVTAPAPGFDFPVNRGIPAIDFKGKGHQSLGNLKDAGDDLKKAFDRDPRWSSTTDGAE